MFAGQTALDEVKARTEQVEHEIQWFKGERDKAQLTADNAAENMRQRQELHVQYKRIIRSLSAAGIRDKAND